MLTQTLILGLIAASVVFLASHGGMISLAQLLLAGIAGFMFANASLETSSRGLNLGWDPWLSVVFALFVATAVGLPARCAGEQDDRHLLPHADPGLRASSASRCSRR